ncbi:hypothetical protein VF10_38075, partial [Nostoc linckia z13]
MPLDFLSVPERTRYESVPSIILEADLRQHFYLTHADRLVVLTLRGETNRLAVALQIGLLRLMGILPDNWWNQLPLDVVEFVARQLRTEAVHLADYGHRQQTRSNHFTLVIKHLGFRRWEPLDVTWLEPWLLERALEHDGERVLLAMTVQKLHQQRLVRPAILVLERLVGSINEQAHLETYRRLSPLLSDELKARLDGLLTPDKDLTITRHRWLVQAATGSNPAAIRTVLDKLKYLREFGVPAWRSDSMAANRQKRLSMIARHRSNRHLERLPAHKRYPILVAFLRESLLTLTDEVVAMFDAFWEYNLAKARREYEQYQQEVAAAKDTALQTLGGAVKVVLDEAGTPADQVRPAIYQTIPRDKLLLSWQAVEALLHPTRHSKLSFLAKRYGFFKQFTPYLLGQIVFQHGFTGDDFDKALDLVIELQQGSRRKLPPTPPSNFIKPLWRKFAYNIETGWDRAAYELSVLATLRDRLRSGDVFVEPSYEYGNLNSYLMPPTEWALRREELCRQLNLPPLPIDRLNQRVTELETLLAPMQKLLEAGGDLRLEDGHLVLTRLTAEEVPPAVKALQEEINRRMPAVDLTDILVEVDNWVGFTH